MEFEFSWIEPTLFICRTSGKASADGFVELFKALVAQPGFRPGVKVLADHTELDGSELSAGDIERIADFRAVSTGEVVMPAALVVGPHSSAKYGLARMFEAYVDTRDKNPMRVFETYDEAMAWLRSLGFPSPPEPAAEGADSVDPAK